MMMMDGDFGIENILRGEKMCQSQSSRRNDHLGYNGRHYQGLDRGYYASDGGGWFGMGVADKSQIDYGVCNNNQNAYQGFQPGYNYQQGYTSA